MDVFSTSDLAIGPYRGRVNTALVGPAHMDWLAHMADHLRDGNAEVLASGRNLNVRLDMPSPSGPLAVVVKRFGAPGRFHAWKHRRTGSKARRTWLAAVHLATAGTGTPPPVAFLERWEGARLEESYTVTVFQAGISSLARELNHIYRHEPDCGKLMALLQAVAVPIRAMHDGGFMHRDLGNQNILLRRTGESSWGDVQFIDLNRGRVKTSLSDRERARDLSRIALPSDFLRVFKEMYYGGDTVPPTVFQRWERHYRRRFAWHSRTRRWRHPFREARRAASPGDHPRYPAPRDIWIWDERSGQPLVTMVSRDRSRHYPLSRTLLTAWEALRTLPGAWIAYRGYRREAYRERVDMGNRVGVAVEVAPGALEHHLACLDRLGPVPVMIRAYHHRGIAALEETATWVAALSGRGHAVSLALVQDRRAILDPPSWRAFVVAALERMGHRVEMVEAGHAINRVKWGVWSFREYRGLMAPFHEWKARHPDILFGGPAMIDFEYAYIPAALSSLPGDFGFDLLTHHLYVDRRGAPEARQGAFSLLEKLALARAVGKAHPRGTSRLVVSEFNWPLAGTGVYSPVGAPYVSPGIRRNDPSVDETTAAAYMLRYALIAICSGHAERIFWWRLAASGYGLVDDRDAGGWRERPGFRALAVLAARWRSSTFTGHASLPGIEPGTRADVFGFAERDGHRWWMAYTTAASCRIRFPERIASADDAFGTRIETAGDGMITLDGMPVYMDEEPART